MKTISNEKLRETTCVRYLSKLKFRYLKIFISAMWHTKNSHSYTIDKSAKGNFHNVSPEINYWLIIFIDT